MTTEDTGAPSGAGEAEASLHYVLPAAELGQDDRVIIDVQGREVAVVRRDGDLLAFSNHCPHQGGPLGEGLISGQFSLPEDGASISDLTLDCESATISCPWHGWSFDLASGAHVSEPKFRIPTYDVVERDGAIYVAIE
jgi:nitrite reductase/ring-hydroxylating ferredoxin subunit